MTEQLSAAQIGVILDGLVESEFDYQETYTDWQDALYDAWDNNQEDPDVIRAALAFLSGNAGNADTVWTPKQFRKLMNDHYKAKYATKGQFAREYVSINTGHAEDTIAEFTDYIDWNRYAESILGGDYACIQLDGADSDVFVFEDDFQF